MVSYDVISLFTFVLVDLALEVVLKKLQNDDDLPNKTDLSVQNIIKLFFINENQFYQQIFGCAMGSPVSAIIANLVMQFIEEKDLSEQPILSGGIGLWMTAIPVYISKKSNDS